MVMYCLYRKDPKLKTKSSQNQNELKFMVLGPTQRAAGDYSSPKVVLIIWGRNTLGEYVYKVSSQKY